MSTKDESSLNLGSVEHILTIKQLRALMKLAAWTTPAQRADSGLTREESDTISAWVAATATHYYGPNWSAIFMALDREPMKDDEAQREAIEQPMLRRCQTSGGI
jgi:hypothetical protein